MEKRITLQEYLRLGGKLEKVDWETASCSLDKYRTKKIKSCKYLGELNRNGDSLVNLNFKDGTEARLTEARLHTMWIDLIVDFNLDSKYL